MKRKIRNTNDQRFKATHALIRSEYRKLLKEKPYQEISVTELCQLVNINRGTFYLHYKDSLGVMEELENDVYRIIISFIDKALLNNESQQILTRQLRDYITENPEGQFLGAVLNGIYGTGKMYDRVCDYINETVSLAFSKAGNLEVSKAKLFTTYLAGGSMAVMKHWYRNNYKDMEQENEFCNLILETAYKVVGIDMQDFHEIYRSTLISQGRIQGE